MNQEKRINVFNKETGMLMRTTVSTAESFKDQGFTHTSKSKLKSFLNRQRRLSNNTVTLRKAGVDINAPVKNKKVTYYQMPGGNIHVALKYDNRYFPQHYVVRFK